MNKKLIITEEQYAKLKFYLIESTFDIMANKVIKKNDIITITTNGKKLEFKVIDNYGGQIYMDNVKDGTRVFLTPTSFQDNKLSINVAQNDEEKNQKPPKGNTWKKMTLMNIEDVYVTRDGDVIDGVNFNEKDKNNKNLEKKNEFLKLLSELNDGETLILETDKITITLVYLSKEGNNYAFKLSDETKNTLNNKNIEKVEIPINKITVDEKGNVIVQLIEHTKVEGGEGYDDYVDEKVSKIKLINSEIGQASSEEKEPEEKQEEEPKEEKEEDFDKDTFIKMLANDEQLKTAYYKNPSKWQSFIGELTGKKQRGTGYTAIQDILRTYADKKLTDKFGDSFLKKGDISFEVLENVDIPYNQNGKNEHFNLNKGSIYKDESSVKRMGMDDGEEDNFQYNLRLYNKKYKFEIIVTDTTDEPNVYLCDVKKLFYADVDEETPKYTVKRSEPVKDVKIKFLESPGYKSKKAEEKK